MPTEHGQVKPETLFAVAIKMIKDWLRLRYEDRYGANLSENTTDLRKLLDLDRLGLEGWCGNISGNVISLNDIEYNDLHAHIQGLLHANVKSARKQGIKV